MIPFNILLNPPGAGTEDEAHVPFDPANPLTLLHLKDKIAARNPWVVRAMGPLNPTGESAGATVGRLLLALSVAAVLIGALLAINWGGPPPRATSVRPGINAEWKSINIGPLVAQLESESREIYAHREQLAALVGVKPGMEVADVGAGSGFMTEIFARQAGPEGRVFALDINPALVGHITRRAREAGLNNIRPMVAPEDGTGLRQKSVDLAFVCDTYHHFEYPRGSLRSIRRTLRNRGTLIVVDLRREPGRSPDWVLEHVRLDKDQTIREIESAGFRFVGEVPAPFLTENYVLRFQRKGQ
jgi:SAM-dependent methyltransferase